MPYLTNKEVQIISFLIKDGIKSFDFRVVSAIAGSPKKNPMN
ncbi:hypothetical protein [Enterococcus faecalis]|nr:hypothetical protein [Enterococcus faecalis]